MTGLSRQVIEDLVVELAPRWQARHRDRLTARARRRAIGGGARHRFGFTDRLLATLVHLRHGLTHDVVAAWFGVHRSTIARSINEVRPLLAERGCRVNGGIRLRTLADVAAHLGHSWTRPKCEYADRSRAGPVGTGSCPAKPGSTP